MELKEFYDMVDNCGIDLERVNKIEKLYNASLPELAKRIISIKGKELFVENYRFLSFMEIQDAEEDLHVKFVAERIIPFIDCMDNDFVVYDIANDAWTKYNIVDKIKFGKMTELKQILR